MAQNLKVGDTIKIISGDNKGQTGKIVKMDRENDRAMIEGIGVRERHMRKTQFNPAGGKKSIHVGIHVSNLELVESAKFEKKSKAGKAGEKVAKKVTQKEGKK